MMKITSGNLKIMAFSFCAGVIVTVITVGLLIYFADSSERSLPSISLIHSSNSEPAEAADLHVMLVNADSVGDLSINGLSVQRGKVQDKRSVAFDTLDFNVGDQVDLLYIVDSEHFAHTSFTMTGDLWILIDDKEEHISIQISQAPLNVRFL